MFGEPSNKPFLKDLFDLALEHAEPADWLLFSNVDTALAPDFYRDLEKRRATVVEYQRQDVAGNPRTLEELFHNPNRPYSVGLDAFAIRAQYYSEIREWLPDFVVGEPHWDTIYTGIFRKLIPVQRDGIRLFHPDHERMWSLAAPSAAGRHNHELFVECLERGLAEKSLISDVSDQPDTAIVAAVFGDDPERIRANTTGIREQLRQDLHADFYLVELLVGDAGSHYPADLLASLQHVPVRGTESCRDLFQKEALLNHGWREALRRQDYQHFILVDADVYSPEIGWFRRIRDRLRQDPSRAVQGWRTVRDSLDDALQYSSVGAAFVLNQPTDLPLNPGICWGLNRALLEAGDGLNPFCIDCSGDSAFVSEYLNTTATQFDPWLYQWGWFREIERKLPFHAQLDCVAADLVHVHHGYLTDRNYDGFRYAMDALPPLRELIALNGDGLLEWKNPGCAERRILQCRQAMGSRAAVDDLFARLSYTPFARRNGRPHAAVPERPLFRVDGFRPPFSMDGHVPHRAPRLQGLKIFDPEEVFRSDFPFSWCDGIVKAAGSTYIPIVDTDEFAVLLLDGLPGTKYVVGALPVQPTWLATDISRFADLRFDIRVSENCPADLQVTMTAAEEDGSEHESAPVYLHEMGLRPGNWMTLSIPLARFRGEGVDLRGIRLVKFVANGSFRMELAKIYLEPAPASM